MQVLIADDHELVRDTIAAFLEGDGIQVHTADDLGGALTLIRQKGPFDLVLLDFEMPGMNGLEGLTETMEVNGRNPVGLLSGTAPRSVAEEALQIGAAGFLPKTMAARSLRNAVRFMAAGETFAPANFMTQAKEEPAHAFDALLTERERQVLIGLTKALSNKAIARDLDLQEVTVKLHVKTLSRKLNARNRTHAALIAKEAGFV